MLHGSIEDNTLTALCWSATAAPQIALKVEAADFSTETYRKIAAAALDFLEKRKEPAGVHIRDLLEDEIARGENGRFIQEIIGEIERLGPLLNEEHVLEELDKFLDIQRMTKLNNKMSDVLTAGKPDEARVLGWEIANTRADQTILPDPWSEPIPPPFDPDILPDVLRDFVNERARATGIDPAGLFWSSLSCCSAALDGSIRLQMGLDPNFTVPPGIWVLLFGNPSIGRTPILENTWNPLRRIDMSANDDHRAKLAAYRAKSKEDQRNEPEPVQTHYIVDNITPEKLGDILAGQERGVARLFDEWAGFVGQFDRYNARGNATGRAFYVECYDGRAGNISTIGRGFTYSKNKHIVPCGGVQPDVLRSYPGLTEDGLLQRFITVILQPKRPAEDEPAGRQLILYEQLIQDLTQMEGQRVIKLSREARAVRMEVEERLQQWTNNDSLGRGFMTFAGKLLGVWGRLTLVLGCIYHRQDNPGLSGWSGPEEIGEDAALLAECLLFEQVLVHGANLYHWLGGSGDLAITQNIAGWLLSHQRARLVASDLSTNIQACRGLKVDEVSKLASPLVTMGWLEPEGRGINKWKVNQRIYIQFPERAAREIYQYKQIQSLIATAVEQRRADENDR